MSGNSYTAFGLCLWSEVELDLPPADARRPDVVVRRVTRADFRVRLHEQAETWIRVRAPVARALVARNGSEVLLVPSRSCSLMALQCFLLGRVMLQVLAVHQAVCLHGGGVRVDGSGVGLVGPSGSGKSSLVAALLRQGAGMLADSLLPVRMSAGGAGATVAIPTYPALRLWQGCAACLGIDLHDAQPLPGCERKYVVSRAELFPAFSPRPVPLRRLYILRPSGGGCEPAVGSRGLAPVERVVRVTGEVIQPDEVSAPMRRVQFATVAALAAQADVRYLHMPAGLVELPRVARTVLDDCADLMPAPAAGVPPVTAMPVSQGAVRK